MDSLNVTAPGIATMETGRRPDLDWLRVGAFFLLILYHVGMAFVTWDWHVKTAHPSTTLEPAMILLNPWRLSLLFFVSGAATRFMAAKMTPGRLAALRWQRLGIPLVFGMAVVVPPQSWVQVTEHGYHIGYWAFYGRYLRADPSFCDAKGCLILPTWNHLWFVAYLLAYTSLLLLVLAPGVRLPARFCRLAERAMAGPGALILPAAWLVLLRQTLSPHFPQTNAFVGDWYSHALYGSLFLLGFWLARAPGFWASLVRWRFVSLGAAIAAYAIFEWCDQIVYPGDTVPPPAVWFWLRADYGIDQWAWIAALLGFAHIYVRRGGPILTYLTQGVFPFYIVHQTIIVLCEFWIKPFHLPAPAEGAILITVTAAGCLATYEAVRRVRWLRPLFGLKPSARPTAWRTALAG
jgi:hypothetical protein